MFICTYTMHKFTMTVFALLFISSQVDMQLQISEIIARMHEAVFKMK